MVIQVKVNCLGYLHASTSGSIASCDADRRSISIFLGNLITLCCGKLCAPSLALGWQIKRLIEVEARVSYHARRWYVHVASAFPLVHHYRAVWPGVL